MNKLLSRTEFREGVFARDSGKCVICGAAGQDAHHILERRLFPDGGYYLDNGATLCGQHHVEAEQTTLSTERIREKAGIINVILPPHFYSDVRYDKWGNTFIKNDTLRTTGELYWDESVQKILNSVPQAVPFSHYVKYPRTWHLPWSGCVGKDDRVLKDLPFFRGEIIVTAKLDGENTSMYNDHVHARSVDGNSHWTQSWVRNLHSKIRHNIPYGWRICGENLFARHSISYDNLESYFYIFSIWNDKNECLSWDETVEYSQLFEIPTVPVIYRGQFSGNINEFHKEIWEGKYDERQNEGYVVRNAGKFAYYTFAKNCGKYVRKNHVTSSSHWKFEKIEKNKLAAE